MSKTRTVQIVKVSRGAPFQVDFPESVVDVNGRPSSSSVHLVENSQTELSPEQWHHIRSKQRAHLSRIQAAGTRERPIDEIVEFEKQAKPGRKPIVAPGEKGDE